MSVGLPMYGVRCCVAACLMVKLPNDNHKLVVEGLTPIARSEIRRESFNVKSETSRARGEGLERHTSPSPFLCLIQPYRNSVLGYRKEEL